MKKMSKQFLYSLMLLIAVFISSVSQVLLKKSALKQYSSKIREYLNSLVIIAYIMFFSATLINVFAYKYVPLSCGPILEATSYLYITFFGIKMFNEKIDKKKILSLLLILIGILIYSFLG